MACRVFFPLKKSKTTAYPVAAIKTIDGWMSCKQTSTTVEKTEERRNKAKEGDGFIFFLFQSDGRAPHVCGA
jgi:hypothetical protein